MSYPGDPQCTLGVLRHCLRAPNFQLNEFMKNLSQQKKTLDQIPGTIFFRQRVASGDLVYKAQFSLPKRNLHLPLTKRVLNLLCCPDTKANPRGLRSPNTLVREMTRHASLLLPQSGASSAATPIPVLGLLCSPMIFG